jgi:hypothetical protein
MFYEALRRKGKSNNIYEITFRVVQYLKNMVKEYISIVFLKEIAVLK